MALFAPKPPPEVTVLGAPRTRLRDWYHRFLRLPWWAALATLVGLVLLLNVLFAVGFWYVGGVTGARPGMFRDLFFFSVHTMCTIGYGSMYPGSDAAQWLVVLEAMVGLLVTALATGMVFSKFSQSTARIVFSRFATVSPMNSVPTLSFRLSNERGNQIVEAQLRLVLVRTERTHEGMLFYRMIDLALDRDRSPAFSRSWTALHTINEKSPLWGVTGDQLKEWEAELMVTVVGIDDTSLQPVYGRHRYDHKELLWGVRLADILSENSDGTLLLDLRRFHETEVLGAPPTP